MDKYIKALIYAAASDGEISAQEAERKFKIQAHDFYNLLPQIAATLGYGSSIGNERFILIIEDWYGG